MRYRVGIVLMFLAAACAPPVVPGDMPGSFAGNASGVAGARSTGGSDGAARAPDAAPGGETASAGSRDGGIPSPAPADAALADGPGAEPDAPLLAIGMACADGARCASGFCVHGVCCNQACDGACSTCAGATSPGTCTPVPAGEDPHEACAPEPVASCGRDGTCDGAGACRTYQPGTQCAPGGCVDATERAASTCSAQGTCEEGATRSCAPNVCQNDSCASACADDDDCLTGFHCEGGACRIDRALASPCENGRQCASGFCSAGVCCASACTEACYSCAVPGSAGSCSPVPAGQDPFGQCPASPATSCGRAGGCNGAGACQLHPTGTQCGASSCADDRGATPAAACDGLGRCVQAAAQSCGAYRCQGTACRSSCTTDGHCLPGFTCSDGSCLPANKVDSLVVHDQANAAGWSLESNFQIGPDGAHPWSDYPETFVAMVPEAARGLLGKTWIRVASASKNYDDGPQATVNLNRPANVHILVDARWEEPRPWTAGFTDTEIDFRIHESSSRPNLAFRLFRRTAGPGAVALPPIDGNRAYNYFVIID